MNRGRHGISGRSYSSNRGRSPSYSHDSVHGSHHDGGDGNSAAGSSSTSGRFYRGKSSQQMPSKNFVKQFRPKQALNSECMQWQPINRGKNASPDAGNLQQEHKSTVDTGNACEQFSGSIESNLVSDKEFLPSSACDVSKDLQSGVARVQIGEPMTERESDFHPLPFESSAKDDNLSLNLMKTNVSNCKDLEDPKHSVNLDSFDICPPKARVGVVLKPPLLFKNRENRNDVKRMEGNNGTVLRPGMVHLKSGISLTDQIKIVKKCRELGLGSGGFYQPEYRDGGKLHLKMMCLGKNWDPETSTYGELRPVDQAKPPEIPVEFYQLVEKAMKDSYALIGKDSTKNLERILPSMKPNICIVNFYSQNGRLGLHQDRDESVESLAKGLPVVSFSIGDSAEFLFGDQREAELAEKVTLESGDVFIFGGKSRHIFHGVTAIHPDTAPKALVEDSNLLAGRLNLTFRQY